VFVIEEKGLRTLPARPFRAGLFGKNLEEALQELIETYPEVLPGKQMDPASDDPPRFVLLHREIPVGDWALDLLLVDQRAMLTLVEAKLMRNPEARREVIGQIMEYAANAAEFWGDSRAREKAREFWSRHGKDVDDLIGEKFGADIDVEAFWEEVKKKLQEGKIRLIIAGDELRPEVRRIVEYLNEEMTNAEVYGLELRCFGQESGPLVLVPRLVGQTQTTADRKGTRGTLWTAERLREVYETHADIDVGKRLREVLDWAVQRGSFVEARRMNPMFSLRGRGGGRIISFFPDSIVYCFLNEKFYPEGAEERDRLVSELKALGMLDRNFNPQDVSHGRNLIRKLTDLRQDELKALLEVFSRFCTP